MASLMAQGYINLYVMYFYIIYHRNEPTTNTNLEKDLDDFDSFNGQNILYHKLKIVQSKFITKICHF